MARYQHCAKFYLGQTALQRQVGLGWKKPNGDEASVICDELCGHQLSTAGLAIFNGGGYGFCWRLARLSLDRRGFSAVFAEKPRRSRVQPQGTRRVGHVLPVMQPPG